MSAAHIAASRALMERAITNVGKPAEVARRLHVTPSHISRICKGTAGLSLLLCFRLADVLDEDPVAVMHACGHEQFSERLKLLLVHRVPGPRAQLYDALDRLSHNDRGLVRRIIDRLLPQSSAPSSAPSRRGTR
jgi:transcriptional regulator with XRE-family HTH domain